jgi:hypothetical protein
MKQDLKGVRIVEAEDYGDHLGSLCMCPHIQHEVNPRANLNTVNKKTT